MPRKNARPAAKKLRKALKAKMSTGKPGRTVGVIGHYRASRSPLVGLALAASISSAFRLKGGDQ